MTQGSASTPPIIDYEGSDYQASFWEQGGRAYEDQVEAIALHRLTPSGGRLMLELGAGAGRNTLRYSGYAGVVLLDYSLSQLQQAQARLGRSERYTYVAADIYRLPFVEGAFDGATMIRTLHHMADAPLALQQIRHVLEPEAIFILEYANKHNLKAILRYWLHRQSWSPFDEQPVEFAALNFDFHPGAVRRWLSANQFEIERQLTVSHFRMGFLKRFAPLRLLVAMDAMAQWTGDWWQLSPSVFTRCRAVGNTRWAVPGSLFACPQCGSALPVEPAAAVVCRVCSSQWAVRDGIYDFRSPVKP